MLLGASQPFFPRHRGARSFVARDYCLGFLFDFNTVENDLIACFPLSKVGLYVEGDDRLRKMEWINSLFAL